jgi:lysine 6-dehydrogenase
MKSFTYLILGAGRQGTAAAYDLAIHGSAKRIYFADMDVSQAENAALRVNTLVGKDLAGYRQVDVSDSGALKDLLASADAALSAVPYKYNLGITQAAITSGVHLCDMGGKTDIVLEQLALDQAAKNAGISILPDCGMGPGLINTVAAYAINLLDEPEEIYIYDAGLPQHPQPPWNYTLTFHINGLTNEMDGQAVFIRDGKIVHVDTLTEPEWIDIPEIGKLEADVTSGGTSTAPWSFLGKVNRYENKVMRYPGHYDWLRAYKALGLFDQEPVWVDGVSIIPRRFYHTLLEPKLTSDDPRDLGIILVRGIGQKDGNLVQVEIRMMDYFDEKTGFTAMERLTGWHCSIMMILQVNGVIPPGAHPHELVAPPNLVLDAFAERGIPYHTDIFSLPLRKV